ncbi:hypothetical protein, partial [Candidatus Ichthyocystis hellenicum]|uniref:hypothetical protein n=1 Tax=Candidatus Ichthyocystis hellenicum TaxID=1561003 RepID=UPI001111E8B4
MITSNVNFLSTVSVDNSSDDELSDSASSSSLSSVSQSTTLQNVTSRSCEVTSNILKKMPLLCKAGLFSAVISTIVDAANGNADRIRKLEDISWNLLKAIVCSLIEVKSEIDKLDAVSPYTVKGYFPDINVEAELISASGRTRFSKDLAKSPLTDDPSKPSNISTVTSSLIERTSSIISSVSVKIKAAEINDTDLVSIRKAFKSYRNTNANTSFCPSLYQFFDDMEAPESTSVSAISTTATTAMPVIATTESTCMSNTSIALVFMLVMSLVALVFFLLGYKCSSS